MAQSSAEATAKGSSDMERPRQSGCLSLVEVERRRVHAGRSLASLGTRGPPNPKPRVESGLIAQDGADRYQSSEVLCLCLLAHGKKGWEAVGNESSAWIVVRSGSELQRRFAERSRRGAGWRHLSASSARPGRESFDPPWTLLFLHGKCRSGICTALELSLAGSS